MHEAELRPTPTSLQEVGATWGQRMVSNANPPAFEHPCGLCGALITSLFERVHYGVDWAHRQCAADAERALQRDAKRNEKAGKPRHRARWAQKCAICKEPIAKKAGIRHTEAGYAHDACALNRPRNEYRRTGYSKRKAKARRG